MAKYDGIIIGAGPNGLTVGAYLAKAGLKVLLLERRFEMGGGLCTEVVTVPGFLHNTHAVYHMMVDYSPVLKDLNLEADYNLKWVYPPLQFVMPFADGSSICLYTDVEKSCASIARFSQKDADAYRRIYHKYNQYMEEFIGPATYHEAIPAFEQMVKLQSSEVGREISELTEHTPKDIVDGIFEHDKVRALFLYLACMWGLDYNMEGLGYLVPLYINRGTNYRLCVNGSHRLAHLMSKFIYDHGGMVIGNQLIKRIIIEDGTAKGVELENGRVLEADKFVCSSIDPYQTFINLVGEGHLAPDFVTRVKDYEWEWDSLFDVHLALEQGPQFAAAASNPEINNAFIYLVGYESEQELINHWEAIRRGELVDGGFNCCFPTVHDPTEAPPGRHIALISQHAPYELKEGGAEAWYRYKLRNQYADRALATLRKYAPNINEDNILWRYIATPLDIENKFADMVKGSIKQGGYFPLQMGYLRPNEECSHHRTPIKNLYLCGASTYSGGCVIWGPGYNAANRVAEDLGIEKWWPKPEIVTRAEEKGLL
jgi:phytoene dehydrogenase-like protein